LFSHFLPFCNPTELAFGSDGPRAAQAVAGPVGTEIKQFYHKWLIINPYLIILAERNFYLRREILFKPPPVRLFTVAQARFFAVLALTPLFS
jgi:hypothetical protein